MSKEQVSTIDTMTKTSSKSDNKSKIEQSKSTEVNTTEKYLKIIQDTEPKINPKQFIQLNRKDYFKLPKKYEQQLREQPINWGFGKYSEVIYYRTYSRRSVNNVQETFYDTIIRVVNGVFTIRKNHYVNNNIPWDEKYMQTKAYEMASMMLGFKLLPPGRGLWAMGTEQMYLRGSGALFNCGAVTTKNLKDAVVWTMDSLMHGIGVGFDTAFKNEYKELRCIPSGKPILFVIADTRESWVKSVEMLIESYSTGIPVEFDYSKIRPAGLPIKTFGGISCGSKPLEKLHNQIREYIARYFEQISTAKDSDVIKGINTRLVADIFNALGYCVVSGNVRRSAEIILGDIDDPVFKNLKNLDVYPERSDICWMSNNTVVIKSKNDISKIDTLVPTLQQSGEPGIINLMNIQKYGRIPELNPDKAFLCNPCGEIPLESYELCNLCEVFPSNCRDFTEFLNALEMATFYCSTVNLLKTHSEKTNAVIARNRRIGVSLSGIADFIDARGLDLANFWFDEGYMHVKYINHKLAIEAGIPDSIRLTTVKPSGTVSILAGVSPGIHYGLFRFCKRRVRVSVHNTKLVDILEKANVPCEPDLYTDDTLVFTFPIKFNNSRSQKEVSLWEQFCNLAFMQRVWSDNMCSITATFGKDEIEDVPKVLKYFLPQIKSCSLLPKTTDTTMYKQLPFEECTEDEYNEMLKNLKEFDWSPLCSDGIDTRFCTNDSCSI